MRILSWNINGVRTLPQYHPWNTLKTGEAILDHVGADIICFQEMKSSRTALPKDIAVPQGYSSFFSFPLNKGGYSGVAVYTKNATCTPLTAQEGLTGKLQPKIPLGAEERVYRDDLDADDVPSLWEDGTTDTHTTLEPLDGEGRALVLDFGLFVLFNLYCPNETSDARLPFKMNYHLLLQERVRRLIEDEKREVIVLGDINICSTPLDHCDGHLTSTREYFHDHPAREWLKGWLESGMIDVVRRFWPDRKGMYTCWNTKINARDSNYGTRVDYILVTPGLLPWIQHGDIQPSLKGSDHCPIYIDLRDSITLESGEELSLKKVLNNSEGKIPRISAKHWDEYSGKQKLLSSFFGKKSLIAIAKTEIVEEEVVSIPSQVTTSDTSPPATPATSDPEPQDTTTTKRKHESSGSSPLAVPKPKKTKTISSSANSRPQGQTKLSSFFNPPKQAKSKKAASAPVATTSKSRERSNSDVDEETLAAIARIPEVPKEEQKQQWSELLAPIDPPKCLVHGEPAKEFTTKQGKNKGKKFWICSRPVGPGWDKGRGDRRREDVNPEYRCDFFKWSSDVRKEAKRSTSSNTLVIT